MISVFSVHRLPVFIPVAFRSLVFAVPGVLDLFRAAFSLAGVPFRVIPVSDNGVARFIPCIGHPCVSGFGVDRRLLVRIVIGNADQVFPFIFVYHIGIPVRVQDQGPVRSGIFLRGNGFFVIEGVRHLAVSEFFNHHRVVFFVDVLLIDQRTVHRVIPDYTAVPVRVQAALVLSGKIVFLRNFVAGIYLFHAAHALARVIQAPVSVVIHGPFFRPCIAVYRVCVSVRAWNQLVIHAEIADRCFPAALKCPFHPGISGLFVVKKISLCVVIGDLALGFGYIFGFHPGIAVRAVCQVVLCVVPAVALDLFPIVIQDDLMGVHRVPFRIILPCLLVFPGYGGHCIPGIAFRSGDRLSVLIIIAPFPQLPARCSVFHLNRGIPVIPVHRVSVCIQQLNFGNAVVFAFIGIADRGVSLVACDNRFSFCVHIRFRLRLALCCPVRYCHDLQVCAQLRPGLSGQEQCSQQQPYSDQFFHTAIPS